MQGMAGERNGVPKCLSPMQLLGFQHLPLRLVPTALALARVPKSTSLVLCGDLYVQMVLTPYQFPAYLSGHRARLLDTYQPNAYVMPAKM